jgi:hypothetical protein
LKRKAASASVRRGAVADELPTRSTVLTRSNGDEVRRLTLYVPVKLARTLKVRAAERDVDMCDLVTLALERYLAE